MASKTSTESKNKPQATPIEYKVTPKKSPGAGHTPAGMDYSDDEWKQIITEWVALEEVPREPGGPSLTSDRSALAEHYQRNYITILKHGRALGMIPEPVPRKPRKSTQKKPEKKDVVAKSSRRGRPKAEPAAPVETPEEATHIHPVLSTMSDKEMRELALLRKVVDGAVASGKLNTSDIIDLLS